MNQCNLNKWSWGRETEVKMNETRHAASRLFLKPMVVPNDFDYSLD